MFLETNNIKVVFIHNLPWLYLKLGWTFNQLNKNDL